MRPTVLLLMIGVVILAPLVLEIVLLGTVAYLVWLPVALATGMPILTVSQAAEVGGLALLLWTSRTILKELKS